MCWPPSTPRWGVGQLFTALSDRAGRKWPIAAGMWVQAAAIGLIMTTRGFAGLSRSSSVCTAMCTDAARSGERRTPPGASAVGVYRLWRDAGFAVGALLAGFVADAFGLEAAIWSVAALTAASGLVVAPRMYETHVPLDHTLERQLIRKG